MRPFLVVLVLLAPAVSAQVHEPTPADKLFERWVGRFGTPTQPVIDPAPNATTRTFDITARQFVFEFNPSPFVVNQGDTVTLNITVPSNDGAVSGHGFLLEHYMESPVILPRGRTFNFSFVANTIGQFTYLCSVSTCGEGHVLMNGTFTVNAAPQTTVASVSPTTGPTSGGTLISLSGTNFQNGATVTIGDRAATNIVVSSATSLTARTPLGPIDSSVNGAKDIVITNPDGTSATKSGAFTWTVPAPAVTAVSPNVAAPVGGRDVLITGAGFTTTSAVNVTFGGIAATNVRVIDAVTVAATAPPHAVGTVDVVVTVGSASATAAGAFKYEALPPRRRSVRN